MIIMISPPFLEPRTTKVGRDLVWFLFRFVADVIISRRVSCRFQFVCVLYTGCKISRYTAIEEREIKFYLHSIHLIFGISVDRIIIAIERKRLVPMRARETIRADARMKFSSRPACDCATPDILIVIESCSFL